MTPAEVRTGIGYDSHRFEGGGPILLGGVSIPSTVHLVGHSDADAICHAITDAILGAAAAGDIGELFPNTDPENKGRSSIEMLELSVERIKNDGWAVSNVDVTVVCELPKIAAHRDAIRRNVAQALKVDFSRVSIKGKTNEGMGWIGRSEGLACVAIATLSRSGS